MLGPADVPAVSPIADVLALWGLDGCLTPPLLPLVAAARPLLGPVTTLSFVPGASGPGLAAAYEALSGDLAGRFVLYGGAHKVVGAVFGEIMATAALARGAAGVLVDGSARDQHALIGLGLPVYASSQNAVGPNGTAHVVATGERVLVGDVSVSEGDSVVCDQSGCVRIPAGLVAAVLDAARRYEAAEAEVSTLLALGEPLASAYRRKKEVVDGLRVLRPSGESHP